MSTLSTPPKAGTEAGTEAGPETAPEATLQAAPPAKGRLVCPACQRALQRRHRHFSERVLGFFTDDGTAPAGRYVCPNSTCGWQGSLKGEPTRRPGYLPDQWL